MEIQDVQRKKKAEIRSRTITVRTFPSYSKWMKENNVSPSKLFNEALKGLMQK